MAVEFPLVLLERDSLVLIKLILPISFLRYIKSMASQEINMGMNQHYGLLACLYTLSLETEPCESAMAPSQECVDSALLARSDCSTQPDCLGSGLHKSRGG